MKDDEMIKLRSTKFFSSPQVHSFLFFVLDEDWVVWEVFSPPPELSSPPEWTCWGGGYGYTRGGGYEYVEGAWPSDELLAGGGVYEYGEGALPSNEPPNRGGWYGYDGYPYSGGGGMDMVEEHPLNSQI
jgi:hypothetical protein